MTKILVVEDEPELRDAYNTIFELQNYDVKTAEHGVAAIETLKTFTPDIIILDMLMPKMDGVEFLRASQLKQQHPKIYVLLLSNMSNSKHENELDELGVDEKILKSSLSPRELVDKIEAIEANLSTD